MGALAVIFCLLLKMAGFSGLNRPGYEIWLFTAPALARTSQVIGLVLMDYVLDKFGGDSMDEITQRYQLWQSQEENYLQSFKDSKHDG